MTLKEILENPKGYLICVDMDGTLCHGEFWGRPEDPEPQPDHKMIAYVTDLYMRGAHITIYTARQYKMFPETCAWLLKHQVPFHGMSMLMKPGADVYIDDKSIRPEELI